jgi:hypothetical protein
MVSLSNHASSAFKRRHWFTDSRVSGMAHMALNRACWLAVVAVGFAHASSSLLAHHSFAMFDTTRRVTVSGTVTAFEWTNPHSYIELDVPDESGTAKHWSVELGSPSILLQGGWKFKDLKYGDKVTVILSPLKNGQPGGLLSRITLPDGRVLGNGPIPAGAPQ